MDRNTTMNDFLAATGLEDIGRALEILDQYDWDLLAAVNSVIPQDFPTATCLKPVEQTHKPTDGGEGSPLRSSDSPLLRMPVEESHGMGEQVEADFVPGLLRRSAAAEPGPDMPELPLPWCSEGGRTPLDMTDDMKTSCFLRQKYNPYDLASPTAGSSEEQRTVQASHAHGNGEHHLSDSESQSSDQYFSPAEEFGPLNEDEEGEEEEEEEVEIEESGFIDPKCVSHGPLIPVECNDAHLALQMFTSNFEARYGSTCPLFFIGSLAEAIKESTGGNADMRKPLLIYLHHDRSILSNIFCSQLLCAESVVNLLSANFISWAWDLTGKQQKEALLQMVKSAFGEEIAESVESVKSDNLPVILIVCKMDGKVEVQNIIQGHTDLETLIGHLFTAMDIHTEHQQRDSIEERARIEREMMIEEQDQRYRESLEADRMKEEMRVEAERQMLQKQEDEIAAKQRCANAVPAEPPPDYTGLTATLRFRCPGGETMQRRFRAEETLAILLNYLGSQGYPSSDYKVLTSYPRRDISQSDSTQTFESLKLCPQETLFVEER